MTKMVAFSGKKSSGKDTSCDFLVKNQKIIFKQSVVHNGQTVVLDMLDGGCHLSCKKYALATTIKRFCMKYLGLTKEQCYGTQEEKESLTTYRWEDMPHVFTDGEAAYEFKLRKFKFKYHEPGFMTAREVIQEWATEIFRQVDPDIHIRKLSNKIKQEGEGVAAICDLRFPNEVTYIGKESGLVFRLMRIVPGVEKDPHTSETLLDPWNFDWRKFSAVIDNRNKTVPETNKLILDELVRSGWAIKPATRFYNVLGTKGQYSESIDWE